MEKVNNLFIDVPMLRGFADIEIDIVCELHGKICGDVFSRLGVPPKCPRCLEVTALEFEKKQGVLDAFSHSGIPDKYRGCTVKNYVAETVLEQEAVKKIVVYLSNFKSRKNLGFLLSGNYGSGKTHLISAIGKAIISMGMRFKYLTVDGFTARITDTWHSPVLTESEVLKGLASYDLLALDEVGSSVMSEVLAGKFNELIDRRYREGRATILCSNLSPKQVEKVVGERIYSRACQAVLLFDGRDRRQDCDPFSENSGFVKNG